MNRLLTLWCLLVLMATNNASAQWPGGVALPKDEAEEAVWIAGAATMLPPSLMRMAGAPPKASLAVAGVSYVFGPVAGYAYADLLPDARLGVLGRADK